MARRQLLLTALWTERFKESYAALSPDRQRRCDEAAISLIKQEATSGLRIKPIHPDKHYWEARLTSGDRIVFRLAENAVTFFDVVSHDDIGRYGRRPREKR